MVFSELWEQSAGAPVPVSGLIVVQKIQEEPTSMLDQIPKRPKVLLPILLVIATSLAGILPPQAQTIVAHFSGKEISQGGEWLPDWAAWLLPLTAVMVLGGYAAYLQWIDQRQYDAMFHRWNGLAKTNGFPPIAEVALRVAPQSVRSLVSVAKKKGSFVVSVGDAKTDLGEAITLDMEIANGGCLGWIRKHDGEYLVHPDLLK